jgi:crotonobetainyl-CoA:carnitine CoA-transferase CaiB-like acyl-CoA transferase
MGQHMAGAAITGEDVPPMPVRRGGWGIYQIFPTSDGEQIFVGVTSDRHWARFCDVFARPDLFADQRLATNEARVAARPWLLPIVAELIARFTKAEIAERCERASIPYAPVAKPADLFADPHLNEGGLVEASLAPGIRTKLPRLPIELAGERPGLHRDAPRRGEHTRDVLADAGWSEAEIAALVRDGVIAVE